MTLLTITLCGVILIATIVYRHPSRKRKMQEMQVETKAQQFTLEQNQGRKDLDQP